MIKNAHEKYYLRFKALGDKPSEQEILKLLKAIYAGIKSGELTKKTCDAELVENMQKALVLTLNSNDYVGSSFDCWRRYYFGGEEAPAVNFNLLLKAPHATVPEAAPAEMRTVSFQAKTKKTTKEPGSAELKTVSFQARVKPKAKTKVKNAHKKYYLRFNDLGDNPSKEEKVSLLNAIQDAIRKRELTSENCDVAVVERMQRVLVEALNGSGRFSYYRLVFFSLLPKAKPNVEPKVIELEPKQSPTDVSEKAKDFKTEPKTKAKPKAKAEPKTKVKAKANKDIQLEPKQSPTTNSTIARATMPAAPLPAVPIQDAVVLKPNTELRCRVYDISEKAKGFKTKTNTNVTTNSTTKRAKPSNRQGEKIRSAKSIAQQEYNLFNAGAFAEIFGEVAIPFSLMVSGVPGSGKTSFLLQLIKHVSQTYARHRLLFVSNEERFNPSLGTKLKRFEMLDCDNLDIADSLPSNLTDYDFIFFDSVQSLRLSVEDFKQQISQLTSAGICLFFVFQATKSGSFRGSLEYEHEVDISLKVEGGRATVGKNRFGGSGSYQIY